MTTLFLLRCQSISPNWRGFFLNFTLSPVFVIALSIKGQRNNSSSNIFLLKNQENGKQRVNKEAVVSICQGCNCRILWICLPEIIWCFFLWIQCCVVFQLGSAFFFFTCFLVLPLICQKNRLCCELVLTWTSDHLLPSWATHAGPHFCINGWWLTPHSVTRGPSGWEWMDAKVEMVSTSISVSWGWHLTPNIYVGGEMQRQEGQGGKRNKWQDYWVLCCFKLSVSMPTQMERRF